MAKKNISNWQKTGLDPCGPIPYSPARIAERVATRVTPARKPSSLDRSSPTGKRHIPAGENQWTSIHDVENESASGAPFLQESVSADRVAKAGREAGGRFGNQTNTAAADWKETLPTDK